MKAFDVVTLVVFSTALVHCLPQIFGDPGSSAVLTFPGFTFTIPVTDSTSTLDRVTIVDPGTGRPTTTTRRSPTTTTSSVKTDKPPTSVSTSTSIIKTIPPTTFNTTTSSIIKTLPPTTLPTTSSSIIKTIPPATSSTSQSTAPTSTSTSIVKTSPPATTTSSKTLTPTTTPSASPTNPWAADCPVPSSFVIKDFISIGGTGNGTGVSLSLTYGNGTFKCPDTPGHHVINNGMYNLMCSDDGLTHVLTDGSKWIYVEEWFYCSAVPGKYSHTLATTANFTKLAPNLLCEDDDNGIQTCFQDTPSVTIPIQAYATGGIIGFAPMDVNGNPLPQCPFVVAANPIVTNTATCTLTSTIAAASSTITPPPTTTTKKTTLVVSNTQTGTVSVIQPPPPPPRL